MSITLANNQPLFTDASYAVKEGGTYEPNQLVVCYRVAEPDQEVAFYALFIDQGVYP